MSTTVVASRSLLDIPIATHLAPNNARVKEALVALEKRERTGDAVNLIWSYLGTGPESDGEKALHALRQKSLPKDDAEQALSHLLDAPRQCPLLDTLTGTLIYRNSNVKKALAAKFEKPVTELFDLFYERGPESLKAFATVPLDEAPWTSKDEQAKAQRDLFRLCIAKLIDVDINHPERLMRIIARQLAVAPGNVSNIIDGDVFEVMLNSLDIRLQPALRSQAMLATSKVLETTKEGGETLFGQYLAAKVSKQTIDDLIVAFSAAAAVFPMIPAVAAQLFMTDGFVQQLIPNLERNSDAGRDGQRYD